MSFGETEARGSIEVKTYKTTSRVQEMRLYFFKIEMRVGHI